MATVRQRLDPDVFRLPVDKIREGYYTDQYFNLTKDLLEAEGRRAPVVMQVFQKQALGAGRHRRGDRRPAAVLRPPRARRARWTDGWDDLVVHALHEGDEIEPWETVLTIEGDYSLFAHLETVYLGCLARRTLVMRNVRAVVDAARGKPILFFPARHDHWLVQTGDGWAAHVAGAIGVSHRRAGLVVGRARHRHGAARAHRGLRRRHGRRRAAPSPTATRPSMNITVLVDFDNDSIGRRSRSPTRSATGCGACGWTPPSGSSTARWRACPDADEHRGVNVRARPARPRRRSTPPGTATSASSSPAASTPHKIARFEAAGAPVDAYGVGSSLLRGVQRLHRRRRLPRRPAGGQGRSRAPPEPPPRARHLSRGRRRPRGASSSRRSRTSDPVPVAAGVVHRGSDLRRHRIRHARGRGIGGWRVGLGSGPPGGGPGSGIGGIGSGPGTGVRVGMRASSLEAQEGGDVAVGGQLGPVAQDAHARRRRQRALDRLLDDVLAGLRSACRPRGRSRPRRPATRSAGRRRRARGSPGRRAASPRAAR